MFREKFDEIIQFTKETNFDDLIYNFKGDTVMIWYCDTVIFRYKVKSSKKLQIINLNKMLRWGYTSKEQKSVLKKF